MRNPFTFTAVVTPKRGYYIAWAEEVPGANTQGTTLGETLENLREAVFLLIQCRREQTRKSLARKRVVKRRMTVRV